MKKLILSVVSTGIALFPCLGSPAAQAASWQPLGPEGGIVLALAFAPSDPRVAYAGTEGGVFRSGDRGMTWTAASRNLGSFQILSLAVDPRDSAVVYAGTAEGLYKTTSGGASWSLLRLGSFPLPVSVAVLRIDPVHPRILYAATSNFGVFRTADGGAHWAERDAGFTGSILALELDPDHPGTLYASVFQSASLRPDVYKTTDGGGSWTLLTGLKGLWVSGLACQPSTGVLYAVTTTGLFVSRDGGATWTLLSNINLGSLVVPSSGALYGTGASGVVRSLDGGETWSGPVPSFPSGPTGAFALALSPAGDRLLAGSASGLGVYSLDVGAGWTQANHGLRAAFINKLAVSFPGPSLLFSATFGEGIFVSADGGSSFVARNAGLPLEGGIIDTVALAVSPLAPRSLVVGFDSGSVAQSSNTGRRWSLSQPLVCPQADTLAVDPPSTIFVAAAGSGSFCSGFPCKAKVSHDGGASFTCLDGPQSVSAFLVDPVQPEVVYAADGDTIWKSSDSGAHFTQVADHLGISVTSLAASPAAHQTLYAGGSFFNGVRPGDLLKSTDGGASWAPADTGISAGQIAALVVDPTNASLVYAALYFGGVFTSRDGGASWSPLGDGFPGTFPTALALDPSRHTLYAGTQGGVWSLALP